MCVYVCVFVCMCVCECERERERKRKKEKAREREIIFLKPLTSLLLTIVYRSFSCCSYKIS